MKYIFWITKNITMIMFIFVETATYLNTLELLFYSVIIAVNDLGLDVSLCRNVTKGEG